MKTIHRSYQFALNPTEEQKILLNKHFGCVRFVYNCFLNQRQEQYEANKKSDEYYAQSAILTLLKKELETAYGNFFKGKAGFIRYKSKKNKNTFTVTQCVWLGDNMIQIPKFKEGIIVNVRQPINGGRLANVRSPEPILMVAEKVLEQLKSDPQFYSKLSK